MKIRFRKTNITGLLASAAIAVQLLLIVINSIELSERINHAMFFMNYVVGFLIIADLVFMGVYTNFLPISFFGCFMLFLMGQKPFKPEYNVFLTFTRVELDIAQYFVFSCILFIGLAVTYSFYLFFSCNSKPQNKLYCGSEETNNRALESLITFMILFTFPCAVYMQGKIVLVRASMTYTSGYLVNVDVPALVKVGYYIYSGVILLYLALKPSKRRLVFALATYLLVEGGFQLLQGRRALFACSLLFIIWYLIKYQGIKTISIKNLIRISVIIVLMVIAFYVVEQRRDSSSTRISMQFLKRFLVSTGGSDSVIANTVFRRDQFPESGLTYLFDPLINNPIGNLLLGKRSVPQGMDYLQMHHSFSHWLSYMTESSLYLSGHGMGSCYLAEVFLAFGMIGVVLVSVFVGWFLNKLNRIEFNNSIFRTATVFFFVKRLFTLPRDGLFSWTGGFVYLLFVFLMLIPFYRFAQRTRKIILKD